MLFLVLFFRAFSRAVSRAFSRAFSHDSRAFSRAFSRDSRAFSHDSRAFSRAFSRALSRGHSYKKKQWKNKKNKKTSVLIAFSIRDPGPPEGRPWWILSPISRTVGQQV